MTWRAIFIRPHHGVVEKQTGRRYMEYPFLAGIHCWSVRSSSLIHSWM
jgi:hypothetical protein